MEQLKPPDGLSFEGNVSVNWKKWIQRFELYLLATGSDKKDSKLQASLFLHVLGESALEVYNSFKFEKESDKFDLEVLKQKFQDYCSPRKNITYERHQFFSRQQQENESIDQYVTDLRNKSATCEFGGLNDSLIRDRIVCGIRSDSLRERMLREPDIKLDTAINMCRAAEVSKTQVKNLGITEKEKMCYAAALNYQNKGNKNHANSTVTYTRPTRDSDKPKQFKCKRCATTHGPRECPAYGKNCSNCNKFGHFAKCCRFERRVNVIEDSCTSESETELFLDTVYTINDITTGNEWLVDMAVGKRKVQFKMDTGAQANILPFSFYKKAANGKALHKTRVKLSTYSGETLPVLGKCMLMCKHNGQNVNTEFLVVNMKSQPILGLQSCEKFGLIQRVMDISDKTPEDETNSLCLEDYADVFSGIGCLQEEHHIEVDPEARPIVHPPRKVPVALRKQLRKELDVMEKDNIIEKVESPTDWVNSLVIVEKSNDFHTLRKVKIGWPVSHDPHSMETINWKATTLKMVKLSRPDVEKSLDKFVREMKTRHSWSSFQGSSYQHVKDVSPYSTSPRKEPFVGSHSLRNSRGYSPAVVFTSKDTEVESD